jgi:sulfur carrier protein ThiS
MKVQPTYGKIMQLKLTLMGALKSKSPADKRLELPNGANINAVLAALDITGEAVQMVMVNGKPQPNRETPRTDGDDLTFVAPVGGG